MSDAAIMRATFTVASHLLFIRDTKVLLVRRFNTGYQDGNYSIPAGHVESDESPRHAAAREAREEVGAEIAFGNDMPLSLVMHRRGAEPRIDFFFAVERWMGEIRNREPEKCDELLWAALDDLPRNMVPYVRYAIECYKAGKRYAEFG